MVIDAEALYDAAQRDGARSFTEKRTGIEVLSLLERLSASLTKLRWVSGEMQFSEALTKPSARQVLADRVRKGELTANPVCRCGEEVVFPPRELET